MQIQIHSLILIPVLFVFLWEYASSFIDKHGLLIFYGSWVKGKTRTSIDYKSVPDHICEDFDDDCYDLPVTHWQCWEHDSKCGVCPFLLQEVTEEMDKIT